MGKLILGSLRAEFAFGRRRRRRKRLIQNLLNGATLTAGVGLVGNGLYRAIRSRQKRSAAREGLARSEAKLASMNKERAQVLDQRRGHVNQTLSINFPKIKEVTDAHVAAKELARRQGESDSPAIKALKKMTERWEPKPFPRL